MAAAAVADKKIVVIIIGAGPAGLAAEVYINRRYEQWAERELQKTPPNVLPQLETIIIEKSDVPAPLWRNDIYENLTLQCRKFKCALPEFDFTGNREHYPSKKEFVDYLDDYVTKFNINPVFNTKVTNAKYLEADGRWEITTEICTPEQQQQQQPETKTYFCKFLVVASGLNAVPKIPVFAGLDNHFSPNERENEGSPMKQIHSSKYKNGKIYEGKKVLVVGCGDSGIDICGDLYNYGATPYIVVDRYKNDYIVNERTKKFYNKVQQGVGGKIDWSLKTNLSELSRALVGNRGRCDLGIIDPKCKIQVNFCSNIVRFHERSVELLDRDDRIEIDCVILATGYNHTVNTWLEDAKVEFTKKGDMQFDKELDADAEQLFKRKIGAVGFDLQNGLHGIKTAVEKVYHEFEA